VGIVVHRVESLDPADVCVRDRIPVTSPARTLIDLAAVASPRALAELVEEAVRLELVDRKSLGAALERHRGRRGVARLWAIAMRMDASAARTRSRLEALYLLLCRERGLPAPLINETVAGMEVDAVFPEQRVAVELDSYGYHGAWSSRQRDHRRAARLSAAGYELLRFDWEQVTSDPDGVHAATAAALRRGEQRSHP
jgi:very-short-patch-repair endonuclease